MEIELVWRRCLRVWRRVLCRLLLCFVDNPRVLGIFRCDLDFIASLGFILVRFRFHFFITPSL